MAILVLAGCSSEKEHPDSCDGDRFTVTVSSEAGGITRTVLDGTALAWSEGDKMGVFIDGLHTNQPFTNKGGDSFEGSLVQTGRTEPSVRYAAYYPYVYAGENLTGTVNAALPPMQAAPFDPAADFMTASAFDAAYDESDMPALNFVFNNHLFSIVRITVSNSDPDLANEELTGIELSAAGGVLTGMFSFDLSDEVPTAVWSSDANALSDKVAVNYKDGEEPLLGLGVEHTLYAVVNPCRTEGGIKLVVKTTNYAVVTESSQSLDFTRGEVVALPAVDVAALPRGERIRTVVFWGDSITSDALVSYLQEILGNDWKVVRGGIPGDTPHGIAGRQGGAPMCFKKAFTIPAGTEKVEIGRLYSTLDMTGAYNPGAVALGSSYWFAAGNCSQLNPCMVNGVECEISYDADSGKYYLNRIAEGGETYVEANTVVESYGSRRYADADVMVTYMGANGGTSDEVLADLYGAMTEHSVHKRHVVVGFHMAHISFPSGSQRDYWTQEYRDLFTSRFGDNFLDLRTVGNENAQRLLLQTGVIYDPASISEADRKAISDGDWPASFSADYLTNVHPNSYGIKALAIMVRERMESLGYLDY